VISFFRHELKRYFENSDFIFILGSRGIENPAFLPTEDPPSYGSFTVVSEIPE